MESSAQEPFARLFIGQLSDVYRELNLGGFIAAYSGGKITPIFNEYFSYK